MREYEDEILRLENTQKHLEEKIESGSNTEKNYKAELGQIEKQLSESSDDIAELLQNVRNLEKESNDLQSKAEKLNEGMETEFKVTAWCPDKKQNLCMLRLPDDGVKHTIEFIY